MPGSVRGWPDRAECGLQCIRAQPNDCAYVGDSPFDIRAAKAAGMHAVAVTWGGIHTCERLEQEHPDAIVDTAEQLHDVL
jgi:pyrophosphatase PpaX